MRGGAESDLKDYLGHRDIRSTRRYVRAAKQRYGPIQSIGLIGPDTGKADKGEKGGAGGRLPLHLRSLPARNSRILRDGLPLNHSGGAT